MKVPESWLPRVHQDELYWFWAPKNWASLIPQNGGSYFSLQSQTDKVLLEVFVLKPLQDSRLMIETILPILKTSLKESHPGLRIIDDGFYLLEKMDDDDALQRMSQLKLMEAFSPFADMGRPTSCHRLLVEYLEEQVSFYHPIKSITESYSLCRGDFVLQINMKTLSTNYKKMASNFEMVAASAMLGKLP